MHLGAAAAGAGWGSLIPGPENPFQSIIAAVSDNLNVSDAARARAVTVATSATAAAAHVQDNYFGNFLLHLG